MERTLVICKPDAVERRLVGEIIARMERKGLNIAAAELRTIDADMARAHYGEHAGQAFFGRLVAFITRSPSLVMVVEGPGGTTAVVRSLVGATDPREALPGTIRGDLAMDSTENLVHASDGPATAAREMALFFPDRLFTPPDPPVP